MAEPRPAPSYEQSACNVEGYRYAPASVQPTAPPASGHPDPAYPAPSNAICDDGFKEIVSSMSGWYDRHGYINKLKVLYRDLVPEPDKLYAANKVNELFELLCTFGHLSLEDPKLLFDTINVTKPFGLEPEIGMLSINVPDIRTVVITKFTQSRQNLIKVVECLTDNVVKKISKLYSCDKKSEKWEVILDLEHRGKICEENMDNFMRNITTHLIIDLNADPLRLRSTGKHNKEFATREPCLNTFTADDQGAIVVTGDRLTGDTDAGQSTLTADGQGDLMVTSDRLIGETDTDDTLTGFTDSGRSTSTDNVCVINNMFEGSAIGCQFINSNITDSVINIVNNTYQTPVTQGNGDTLPSTTHRQQSSQDEVIKKYLLGIQKQSCRNATRFTPAILNTRYEVDIAHMFTDLDLLEERKKKQGAKPTTLREVLSIIKSTAACKVLFEGEGGIGKTTLLRYIAYSWATDESDETFKGKIIFLVNISSIDKNETILDAILKQIDLEDFQLETYLAPDPILIKRFIRNHSDEIVLLLDGLDELKDGSESPVSYFKKKKMDSSKVILTSRSEKIDEYIKASDIHVKVKGFNSINIQKYIKRHFKFVENRLLGDALIRHIYKHSEVNSMCKNPMLLLLVCTMWEERQQLPENKSDLFKEIFRCIINQYIDKQETNKEKISKYEAIPERFIMAMIVLGKCMYKSLKKNQLSINKSKLEGQSTIVALSLKLGFVYKDAPNLKSDFEEIYTAPHKFIVESLVGFYLCKLCQAARLESEWSEDMKKLLQPLDDNEWKVVKESEHLNTAREFVIGFLGADAGMFLNHWITNSLSTYRSLMAHLKFVKVEYSTSVKKALFDHMTNMKNFGIRPYINEICKSLREFIYIFSSEDIENEHFIHIMQQVYEMSLESLCEIDVETRIKYFFNKMSSEEKGKTIAHILIAISDQIDILEIVSRICGDEDIKYLTAEFQKLNFKYDLTHLTLCEKMSDSFIVHLLSNTPQLEYLQCSSDSITGAIMNDVMKEFSVQEVKLELKEVYLSNNNLCNIESSSLTSLLVIAPKLSNLSMLCCSLSGDIVNDMIRECCSRGVKLELKKLDIRDKNLNNIDGSLFASLLGITSKLEYLSMHNNSSSCYVNNNLYGFSLEICGKNLIDIDGSSLADLIINIKLNKLTLHSCNLSGDVINDMIRECCSRGVKLDLNVLNIVGSDLCNIDGSLFVSLLGINCKFVSVSMRNGNSSFEVINHHNLSISGNNLINIDGSSLAALLISFKLNKLTLNDCSLSVTMVDDMVRECCSRGVKLELIELDISDNNLNNIDGSSLTSLLDIVPMLSNLNISNCSLSGSIMNDMTRECCSRGVKLEVEEINISDNDFCNINGSSLTSLLVIAPTLSYLTMSNCSLSGVIMNDMMKDCCNRGIKLELKTIDICGNDFCNIDGSLFVSLLRITSKLEFLSMSNGTSSCYFRNHYNHFRYLSIIGNNLIDFDAYSLAGLLITLKLNKVTLKHCNASGVIMKDMIRECCSQRVNLELKELDISDNDLYNIDGSSLGSLFIIAPKLSNLNMCNCSLSGDIMNDMIREWCSRGVRLELIVLDISDNNLKNISGSLFVSLLGINKLQYLSMRNGSSSFSVRKVNGFRYRNDNILRDLYINGNNLINIDGSTLATLLITFKLNKLTLNDCSLSVDIMNDMISKCCNEGVNLELQVLNIHDNGLCNINNSLFASFLGITCNLESLSISNGNSCYVISHHKLDIKGNTLVNIDGSSLAALLITFKLKRLTLSDCSLSGIIVNDMIRVFCSRGVKLELKELNIIDNVFCNVNNSLFVSLLGITCKLKVSMRNGNSSCEVINHHNLSISGNTLISMDGCSLAALLITLNVNRLTLNDCGLSGGIINDMMKEYFRGVKLKLKYVNISDNDLSTIDGSSLTSFLVIAPTLSNLIMCNCSLSGVVMNDMIRECCNRGIKLQLNEFCVSGNNLSNIEGSSLISLFGIAPKLSKIKMSNCSVSGVTINDMMRGYCSQEIKLCLKEVSVSGNDLNIDGSVFVSLLGITSKLEFLSMSNCSSSCYFRNRHELNISGNNLINIDSTSLAALLINFKLNRLILNYCSLSGAIMNGMVKECFRQGIELQLRSLNISGNNLSNIDSSSLTSLFVVAPELSNLDMSNCSLSGAIMNYMVKECCSQGVQLELQGLNISSNNLSNIDSSSLTSLFVIAPTLSNLNISNCSLSGDIMNAMIRECCSQGVKLNLETVDVSHNNLNKIDGTICVSLMGISSKPKHLKIRNGSSSCDVLVSNKNEFNLHNSDTTLYEIFISGNNFINIDGCLSPLVITKLVKLKLNDCSLSVDIMNDMIRECCSKEVKLELRVLSICDDNLNKIDCPLLVSLLKITKNFTYLSINNSSSVCEIMSHHVLRIIGNILINIDGSSLATLLITFKVGELILNNCSLSGAIMNDMMRDCCDRGIKFEFKKIDISDNNLRNIDGSLFASLLGITKLKSLLVSNGSSYCNFYTLRERDISGNNLHDLCIGGNDLMNVDGSLLANFLITFKLKKLILNDGSISGVIMNVLMRECCTRGVILELYQFDVSGNNLSNIDESSLTSFLVNAPRLSNLNMCNCSLSGNIVNNMIRECFSKGVKFKLKEFYINGNNLSNIYGSSLTFIFVIAPALSILNISNCSLSGVIMKEMIRECCSKEVKLELKELNISGNKLSNINDSSLSSLLAFTPTLRNFNISNCSLSCAIKNEVMRECYNRRIKLKL